MTDINTMLWGHTPRPYRPRILEKYLRKNEVSQEEINQLVQDVWLDYEFPGQMKTVWRSLWRRYQPTHNIKEPIQVFRGGVKVGYSFTTDYDKAVWFAKRNLMFERIIYEEQGYTFHGDAKVWSAIVKPAGILFTTNDRNESEVVVKGWAKNIWISEPTIVEVVKESL